MSIEQNGIATYFATDEIKTIIRNTMSDNCNSRGIEKEFDYDDDVNIYELGLVDSLDTVAIVIDLETEFGMMFSDSDQMKMTNNCSLNNIFLVLTQYIKPSDV